MTATDQTPATERVEQIRARLDAATEGPWCQGRENDPYESVCDVYSKRSPDELDSHDIATYIWCAEDAALIAHARDDIPWLLNQLAEQAATIEAIRTARADHPTCDVHPDDGITCGWKRAVADIDLALNPTQAGARP